MAIVLVCAGCAPTAEVGTLDWISNESSGQTLPTPVAPTGKPQLLRAGAELFAGNCAPCHRSNGEGNLNRFPPLNDSPLVIAQMPTALIETVLYGRQEMPAFAPTLNNAEVAAVLSYVRQAWSNQASIIEPDQVQAVRQQRTQ
jgi:mono/diheme cytochrome c family protein